VRAITGSILAAAVICGCTAAPRPPTTIRIAVFNIRVLSTDKIRDVDTNGVGRDPQLRAAGQIIRRIDPDVLILNELWHDYSSEADSGLGLATNARRFDRAYVSGDGIHGHYDHAFAAPCNTGKLSGFDLNRDGVIATRADLGTRTYADDCWGWGMEPGAFSLGVLSKFPIESEHVRTFARFLWRDLGGNHIPEDFYPDSALDRLPLSSKAHWDIPIRVGAARVHLFLSVPTPGIFDGPEDRNGRRNFDEIGFWVRYIDGDSTLYDDDGAPGGYGAQAPFVIAGDLNAFAEQDSRYDGRLAIAQLLEHPRLVDTGRWLTSRGAVMGDSAGPPHYPERRTVLAGDFTARLDYILPSNDLEVLDGGVFWPSAAQDSSGSRLAELASDHRLVWLDLGLR